MGHLTCQIVRPDQLLYEGDIASMVLVTPTGEFGIWPGHAAEICALGSGVMRITLTPKDGGQVARVVISGGYAQVSNDVVIVLTDHARRIDDIEPEQVELTRQKAQSARDALAETDHRRAYYENKIAWCDLLLECAETFATSENNA